MIYSRIAGVPKGHRVAEMKTKWDIPRPDERTSEISRELGWLLRDQAEFFRNGTRHTADELREYEASRVRVCELFAELERLRKAA